MIKSVAMEIGFKYQFLLDSNLIREFYTRLWSRKIALSDEDFYNWQFVLPPDNNLQDHCVLAVSGNEIIGVMGLNVRVFSLNGCKYRGAELTTWIVDPKFAGLGAGAKMLAFIQSEFDILIGMGITDQALSVYMRSGFRYLASIPRFIKILDVEAISTYGSCSKLGKKLIKKWRPVVTSNILVQDVDWLSESEMNFEFNGFDRSVKSLRWRYSNHPYFNYKSVRIQNDQSFCYVVFREEKCSGFTILRVVDILGDECNFHLATQFIDNYIIDNNIAVADFFCTASRVNQYLIGSGWFSILDDKSVQFPHLFQPIELRMPATTSLIYWSKIAEINFYNIYDLYITKSDADFDRPTSVNVSKQLK